MDTVSLMASEDLLLYPVRAAAAIKRQIIKYPVSSKNSPILKVLLNGIIDQVTSSHMIDALRDTVVAIREVTLGVKEEEVGTHLIRSGAAMTMYIDKCPIFMIMLIGCWSSNAFLCHIRKQVIEFSQNVAKMMLSCQNF
jgi:hypothetical protein